MQIYPLRNNSVNNLSKCVFKGNEDNKNFIGKGEVEYSHDIFKKTEREAQKAKNAGKKIVADLAKKVKK